jgi:hypothetical protein
MNDRHELKFEFLKKGTFISFKKKKCIFISYDEMINKTEYKKSNKKYFIREHLSIGSGLFVTEDYEIDRFKKEMDRFIFMKEKVNK